jgi:hypothetical protein
MSSDTTPKSPAFESWWEDNAMQVGSSRSDFEQCWATAVLAARPAWQPIETAPKDGAMILLARNQRVTLGHWEPEHWPTASEHHASTGEYLGQFETGQCDEAYWASEDGGFTEEEPPSHWMPLPTPPGAAA